MKVNNIKPVALISKVTTSKGEAPAAALLNKTQDIEFDSFYVAGACIALYEAFLSSVPESKQIIFEEQFQIFFNKMFEEKEQYLERVSGEIEF